LHNLLFKADPSKLSDSHSAD